MHLETEDMATAEDQISHVHCGPRRTLRSDRGGYQVSKTVKVCEGRMTYESCSKVPFRFLSWLAVPLTSEKGCLGNMVNSMLRHFCGHIFDIIRHIHLLYLVVKHSAALPALHALQ
eukprot:s1622_g6.t1